MACVENDKEQKPACVAINPVVEVKLNKLLKIDRLKAMELAKRYNRVYEKSGVWFNYYEFGFKLQSITFYL